MRNVFIAKKPTRSSVRKQGVGAADDQRGRNVERARQIPPHSAEGCSVLPATACAFQDRRAQRCELGRMVCDTKELKMQTLEARQTPDLCWNHDASCDLCHQKKRINSTLQCAEHAELWDSRH